jgi:hypothetical protein
VNPIPGIGDEIAPGQVGSVIGARPESVGRRKFASRSSWLQDRQQTVSDDMLDVLSDIFCEVI